ncbi:MAG: 3-oxoacyl-[acyl-carrier-protein] synthase III C-terminal domain-containing protein [Acidobacteriota bacterium]
MNGSIQFAGFGESEAVPSEMVDNERVMENLRRQGIDTRGKTGEDTEALVGIRTRWWSNLSSTEHALAASRSAIEDASRRRESFDSTALQLVHSGGSSPDNLFPACACEIQGALGIPPEDCEARDVSLACCSWLDALLLAASRLRAKSMRWGLVAVGESIGTRLNAPTSLSHCLWGDAGGAVVLEHDPDGDPSIGLFADKAVSDGQFAHWTRSLKIGTHPDHADFPQADASMLDHGKDIHRYAIRTVSKVIADLLDEHGLSDETPYLVPHNSNLGMVRQIGKRLGIADDRILTRIVERGNTSSASIPITLAHYAGEGRFTRGDLLVLAAFGGGMAIDVALYRWP